MSKNMTKIVIVGHVDHGKSTLIGRILLDTKSLSKEKENEIRRVSRELGKDTELAFLTDQLKEERERNITIDTTQIFFHTRKRNYCIIDAPGHVEFIKNMMTGASQAEHAVLIIDAREGIQEQSRRHAYLIFLLGITRLVVVVNKMDLVGYSQERFNALTDELKVFLGKMNTTPLAVIPISAKAGDNISKNSPRMSWYKGKPFLYTLDRLSVRAAGKKKPFRMSVQDVYDQGDRKIIVGEISSGTLKSGQSVVVCPDMRSVKIQSIRSFQKTKDIARHGENIGLTFTSNGDITRGDVLAEETAMVQPTDMFRANIFWMAETPLSVGKRMTLKCATQEVEFFPEKIEKKINSDTLENIAEKADSLCQHESGTVILKTARKVVVENFDFIEALGRFVIEKDDALQGAGIILGPL